MIPGMRDWGGPCQACFRGWHAANRAFYPTPGLGNWFLGSEIDVLGKHVLVLITICESFVRAMNSDPMNSIRIIDERVHAKHNRGQSRLARSIKGF